MKLLRRLAAALALCFATPAFAEAPVCTGGADLVAVLKATDATAYRAFETQLARLPDSRGILFKVSRKGLSSSYLYGTMHATDERLLRIARATKPYVARARTVATELGDFGAFAKAIAVARILAAAASGERDALAFVPTEKRKPVEEFLEARGLPASTLKTMPPWMAAVVLAFPLCEMQRQQAGLTTVDEAIVDMAKEAKAPVEALETIDEQFARLASLDGPFVGRLLVYYAARPQRIDDSFETMIALYEKGRIGALMLAMEATGDDTKEEIELGRTMLKRIMGDRNATMRTRAEPLLRKGRAFVAVGALHLVGPDGLVALLRKDGYTLTRLR